jgi:uncharacterized protein YyaL (SSP411 family)
LAELAQAHFGITEEGNFEGGSTILELVEEPEDLAKRFKTSAEAVASDLLTARKQMFDAREQRIKPGRDEKILAGWNGLMIRGLAFAARVFGRADWIALAKNAADVVLDRMWSEGRLLRARQGGQNRIDGFIEDYGDLAAGLVALYQASFDPRYLEAAEALVNQAVRLFWDEEKQAYRSAPKDSTDLFCATYALHDNAFPSGASTLTEAQVALAAITGRRNHFEQAGKYLGKMRGEMLRNPFGYGHLMIAADNWLEGAAEVTLVGSRAKVQPLLEAVNSSFAPTLALAFRDPSQPNPTVIAEALQGRDEVNGRAAAYLCRNFSCQPPITDGMKLKEALTQMPAGS